MIFIKQSILNKGVTDPNVQLKKTNVGYCYNKQLWQLPIIITVKKVDRLLPMHTVLILNNCGNLKNRNLQKCRRCL